MRRIRLELFVPVLLYWFVKLSDCAPQDNVADEDATNTIMGRSESILKHMEAKMIEISKRTKESEGIISSILERLEILQGFSERLEQMSRRMESTLENIQTQLNHLDCTVSVESLVPKTTEATEVVKINTTDSGQTGTPAPLTNLNIPAIKFVSNEEINGTPANSTVSVELGIPETTEVTKGNSTDLGYTDLGTQFPLNNPVTESVLPAISETTEVPEVIKINSTDSDQTDPGTSSPLTNVTVSISVLPAIPATTEVIHVINITSTESGQTNPGTQSNLTSATQKLLSVKEIKDLVSSPRATLFSEANFTGDTEGYNFRSADYEGGCHNLEKLRGKVGSVDTKGKCLRLFDNIRCWGSSLAIYPGSGNSHQILTSKLTRVSSIGPCLEQEFLGSFFQDQTKRNISKGRSADSGVDIPDLLEFHIDEKWTKGKEFPRTSYEFSRFTLGPKNRVEFLLAVIRLKDLPHSPTTSSFDPKNSTYFESLTDKEERDVPGYGLSPNIGGPVNESFNIFPQSPSLKNAWDLQTFKIQEFLRKRRTKIAMSLNFEYKSERKTRPFALYFYIHYIGTNRKDKIIYGRLLN